MNMLTVKQLFMQFSFIIAILVLAACQPRMVDTTVPPVTSVADPPVTSDLLPTIIATSEATRTPLPTSTAIPTNTSFPSPTATIPPSPTATSVPLPTPRPTLTSNEALVVIDDWFREPPCLLPCWWNLIPGQSNWVEVNQQLDYLGLEGSSRRSRNQEGELRNVREARFDYPEDIHSSHAFTFYFDPDDTLLDITQEIRGIGTEYFPLSLFLKQYGQPDEIMMSVVFNTPTGAIPFRFVLGYWQKGIAVVYEDIVPGRIASQWTSQAAGCFRQMETESLTPYMEMLLWDPETTPYSWQDMGRLLFVGSDFPYLSLEEATGISTEQFYVDNVNHVDTACVHTPIELWAYENFYWCEARQQVIPITEECSSE